MRSAPSPQPDPQRTGLQRREHPATIRWYQCLEARVTLAVASIAVLTLGTALLTANRVVTRYSLDRSEQALKATRLAFDHLVATRAAFAEAQTRLIVEVPAFRASMDIHDAPTVAAMAADYVQKLNADFCIVTDARGSWLGSPGWRQGRPPPELLASIAAALNRTPSHRIVALHGELYLVVTEPGLFAEEVIGTLTAGYRLDDRAARELAAISQCQVGFLTDGRLCGSSLPTDQQRALRASRLKEFSSGRSQGSATDPAPSLRRVGMASYVTGVYPLGQSGRSKASRYQTNSLVLLQDWSPTQRFLDRVNHALVWTGAIALLLVLSGSVLLSRGMTAPLKEIARAADEIAGGNWSRQVPVRGTVEAVLVAGAFNRMSGSLTHWRQEAATHARRSNEALAQLGASYTATLQALSRALDTRDNETEGHSRRVTEYALKLAGALEVDEETRERLYLGALLHDIGKIGVPDAILRKPGKLDDQEWEIMRQHCDLGLRIVSGIPRLEAAAAVIGYHHERYDGRGYPFGLVGNAIPLEARIFMVCDTLDAMTSDRPYRRGLSLETALAEIERCSGTQFDPRVVTAFLAIREEIQALRCRLGEETFTGPLAAPLIDLNTTVSELFKEVSLPA